jgi:hypothetical protein
MKIEGTKLMKKIMDKQFEIIGVQMKFEDIPESGMVKMGKKEVMWWDAFKMTEEQEKLWKAWAANEMKGNLLEQGHFTRLDLVYGFVRKYEKAPLV